MTADQRRSALTAAVLSVIDGMSTAELIGAVTPERIGQELGYSASSVRYQFGLLFAPEAQGDGNPTWRFDRDRLWEVILVDIRTRVLATTVKVRDTYLEALDRVETERDPSLLVDAVRDDLDAYAPGASAEPTALSERAYLLAVAASDGDPTIGRQLAEIRERELELYEPVHQRGLALTGRRPVAGETLRSIAHAVANLAEGASIVRRYGPAPADRDRSTARGMLAVFLGLTEPDPEAGDAPLRGLACLDG